MATTVTEADPVTDAVGVPWWSRALRLVGWLLISAGIVVGLFIVYLLFWTDRETAVAQDELVGGFEELVRPGADRPDRPIQVRDLANIPVQTEALPDDPEPDTDPEPDADPEPDPEQPVSGIPVPADAGDSYALIWFQRGGEFIIDDGVIGAVQGVTLDDLQLGPGHYPESEAPGQAGNVAFAGHRTTYGKPFHNLDQLEVGDEIHIVDAEGRHWVYDFRRLQIVDPTDVWVVDDGALPGVDHLLTLTSCHPKYSAAQRIIAFAELRSNPGDSASDPTDDPSAAPTDTTTEPRGVR